MKKMRGLLFAGLLIGLGVGASGAASAESRISIDIVDPISMSADAIELGVHHVDTNIGGVSSTGKVNVTGGSSGYTVDLNAPATLTLSNGGGEEMIVDLTLADTVVLDGTGAATAELKATVQPGTIPTSVGE